VVAHRERAAGRKFGDAEISANEKISFVDPPQTVELAIMNRGTSWAFYVCAVAALTLVAVTLEFWGAAEIRATGSAVFFLTFVAAVWLILATKLFPWLGLSLRDDAVERKNLSALIALCGAVLALGIIYAGANIGEGPSYTNNFFCDVIGTASFFLLWFIVELVGKISRSITEDRDLTSGLRMCGLLLAFGLIIGRALAGNWHSEAATVRDFIRDGWPAAILLVLALIVEPFARPNRRQPIRPFLVYGLLPAALYVSLAAVWLWHLGAWEGMHK
jgi:uncharacterized membrane protein YjfL (UPF0719 family)